MHLFIQHQLLASYYEAHGRGLGAETEEQTSALPTGWGRAESRAGEVGGALSACLCVQAGAPLPLHVSSPSRSRLPSPALSLPPLSPRDGMSACSSRPLPHTRFVPPRTLFSHPALTPPRISQALPTTRNPPQSEARRKQPSPRDKGQN